MIEGIRGTLKGVADFHIGTVPSGRPDRLAAFRKQFDLVFAPFGLASERYAEIRPDLELVSDSFAGPMYAIYDHGNCDYVFDNDQFPGIHDVDDLMGWFMTWISEFRRVAATLKPSGAAEQSDDRCLARIAEHLEELARMAFEIMKEREGGWNASSRSNAL
jgi:hypothetical protein